MFDPQPATNSYPVRSVAGTLEVVKRAAQDGAADAREAAHRTWAATSLFMSRFVYTTCYTLSYGVVFPVTLCVQAIPRDNAAVRGLIDGAQAAKHKVEEIQGPSLATPNAASVPTFAPA
jgi:hypothetical protein